MAGDSDRERNDRGQFAEEITLEDVIEVLQRSDSPVVTAKEVGEKLGYTSEAARQKLLALRDQGIVERRQVVLQPSSGGLQPKNPPRWRVAPSILTTPCSLGAHFLLPATGRTRRTLTASCTTKSSNSHERVGCNAAVRRRGKGSPSPPTILGP